MRAIECYLLKTHSLCSLGTLASFFNAFDTAVHIEGEQIQVCSKHGISKCYLVQCQTNVQIGWTQSFRNAMVAIGSLDDPVIWYRINYAGMQ